MGVHKIAIFTIWELDEMKHSFLDDVWNVRSEVMMTNE